MARAVRAGEQRRGRVAAFGDDRLVAGLAHHVVEQPALHGIVIDDQNTLTHDATFCTQHKTQSTTWNAEHSLNRTRRSSKPAPCTELGHCGRVCLMAD